jgi:hypothetical protein
MNGVTARELKSWQQTTPTSLIFSRVAMKKPKRPSMKGPMTPKAQSKGMKPQAKKAMKKRKPAMSDDEKYGM